MCKFDNAVNFQMLNAMERRDTMSEGFEGRELGVPQPKFCHGQVGGWRDTLEIPRVLIRDSLELEVVDGMEKGDEMKKLVQRGKLDVRDCNCCRNQCRRLQNPGEIPWAFERDSVEEQQVDSAQRGDEMDKHIR